ncbi:hypothetical protein H8356DRAFT_1434865 [Neocallimastix lanati (nom. inval.)]|nr:hypothetical protein H8356DRAFT_1436857 [Neocallimastix sp. JGI-2020a]KAG4085937.1 hypothetical protein H8356DRAFT_1434865 [Neocallimastix sp. JGI-2020a]
MSWNINNPNNNFNANINGLWINYFLNLYRAIFVLQDGVMAIQRAFDLRGLVLLFLYQRWFKRSLKRSQPYKAKAGYREYFDTFK